MSLVQSKQINKTLAGIIKLVGLSATGASTNISTALGAALATAGYGGVSVPLQPSTGEGIIGAITTGSTNRIEISEGTLKDASGREIYGRLTESGGVYTLTYYTLVGATETAYTGFAATTIDADIPYRFDFARLPADFAISTAYKVVSAGVAAPATRYTEQVTVTGVNTLADLTKTPDVSANLVLFVNGLGHFTTGNADFTNVAKVLTWNSTNAGFSLAVSDRVIAQYTTTE